MYLDRYEKVHQGRLAVNGESLDTTAIDAILTLTALRSMRTVVDTARDQTFVEMVSAFRKRVTKRKTNRIADGLTSHMNALELENSSPSDG
jgi:hypothetical protein